MEQYLPLHSHGRVEWVRSIEREHEQARNRAKHQEDDAVVVGE